MTEKRFTPYKNNDRIVGFKDNITGKHHCSIIEARWLLNHFWEKTQRLTEENIRYEKHIEDLTQENKELKKENEQLKSKGLKVLEFYEYKLKNADRKEFENAREELWIVKEVLCEMEVIKDE